MRKPPQGRCLALILVVAQVAAGLPSLAGGTSVVACRVPRYVDEAVTEAPGFFFHSGEPNTQTFLEAFGKFKRKVRFRNPKERAQKLVELYHSGLNRREIAEATGLAYESVKLYLNRIEIQHPESVNKDLHWRGRLDRFEPAVLERLGDQAPLAAKAVADWIRRQSVRSQEVFFLRTQWSVDSIGVRLGLKQGPTYNYVSQLDLLLLSADLPGGPIGLIGALVLYRRLERQERQAIPGAEEIYRRLLKTEPSPDSLHQPLARIGSGWPIDLIVQEGQTDAKSYEALRSRLKRLSRFLKEPEDRETKEMRVAWIRIAQWSLSALAPALALPSRPMRRELARWVENLNDTQREILDLLMQGLTQRAISRRLGIGFDLVMSRTAKMYTQLGETRIYHYLRGYRVTVRVAAALWAVYGPPAARPVLASA